MAEEGAVQNTRNNRFFCHKCNRVIHGELPSYTCPSCCCGFIEVLENGSEHHNEGETDMDLEIPTPFDEFEIINEMLIDAGIRNEERRGGRRRSARSARNRQLAPVENFLQDVIMNLPGVSWGGSNTIGVGTARTGTPGGHLLLMANPGDYAWGREGLDAIVTQLLNQMDTAGPPPLAKEKINQIPRVLITKNQQETNIQCSVCWEEFKLEEHVRKLPCEHLYHENCIIPWLELHGTCPICRKTLSDDVRADDSDAATNAVSLAASLFRYSTSDSSNSGASSSSSSSASGSGAGSSSGSSMSSGTNSSRPDFNMDMEFD